MNRLTKWLGRVLLIAILVLGGLTAYGYQQWQQLEQNTVATVADKPLFVVARGETTFHLINRLSAEPVPALHRKLWLRFHPELAAVRQGTYKFEPGTRLRDALMTIVNGDVYRLQVTLVEGLRLSDWLQRLAGAEYLKATLADVDDGELAERLGVKQSKLEGLFLPETYSYTPGDTDISILQRAHQEMERFLDEAWAARQPGLPIETPYEALILASIIEKETAVDEERDRIAGVFTRRLLWGLRLLTDPTVI
ncbi:MAG: endolytic transglycosylase MltG [Oceanisphaera sp.]|nr:endolytic transglycosylase MltG [Oceanisphaera sp.]